MSEDTFPGHELNLQIEILKGMRDAELRLEQAYKILRSWTALPEQALRPFDYQRSIVEDKDIERVKEIIREKGVTTERSPVMQHSNTPLLRVNNYLDNVNNFYHAQPFFFDKTGTFWIWALRERKYVKSDDIDMMHLIEQHLGFRGETITSGIKNSYLEAFKRIGRQHIPNTPPKDWIQFKETVINIKTQEEFKATPEYFFTNPILWNIGSSEETPTIDKLFTDWLGEEKKKTLYEILAYSCYQGYPIHIVIALVGSGRNGKTSFLKIQKRFIGEDNVTSTEMDTLIDSRFECTKLYKKLSCVMGETNFGILQKSSLLKKLCGEDLVGGEYKNKTPFDFQNYAKIIIASNGLPISSDTSDGWYRRWLIINFKRDFPEGHDVVETIPDVEYDNLAKKIIKILPDLLSRGSFTYQGTIDERKNNYILSSNPITLFLQENCDFGDDLYCKSKDLFFAYNQYLKVNKRRGIKKKEFSELLSEEGYQPERKEKKVKDKFGYDSYENSYWIEGLALTNTAQSTHSAYVSTSFVYSIEASGHTMQNVQKMRKKGVLDAIDPILMPCSQCGAPSPSQYVDQYGKPLCELCGTEEDLQ